MNKPKEIRLAGIIYESMVNGPGIRRVLFSQGCMHNCDGCFNQETHPMDGGELVDIELIINDINTNQLLNGVTFSGGDPFERPQEFSYIAENVIKEDFNIWCYTGYTFEFIINNFDKRPYWKELLSDIDVLIDGKFDKNKNDDNLKYRGSRNQRIIDVKESLKFGKVIELQY